MTARWWERGVIYQVYLRSYADSNGDGIGDLPGLIGRLDHLEWLGVDAVWLSPTFPSPNADWGYDCADYLGVHPDFGTLADLEHLIVEAGRRDIRVMLDLVPNHTSDAHAWFHDPARRDWYVWSDPKPDGSPPNNWKAAFGGDAWTLDEAERQLLPAQLPCRSSPTSTGGTRTCAAHSTRSSATGSTAVSPGSASTSRTRWSRTASCATTRRRGRRSRRPWARIGQWPQLQPRPAGGGRRASPLAAGRRASTTRSALLLGETYVLELDRLMPYYVNGDGLQLCMNFPFLHSAFVAEELAAVVARTERAAAGRRVSGLARVEPRRSALRDALVRRRRGRDSLRARRAPVAARRLRSSTRATRSGSRRLPVPPERERDVAGRDPCRTPMVWEDVGRRRVHGAGRRAVASDRQPRTQRRRAARRSRLDPHADARSDRAARHRGLLTGGYEPVDSAAPACGRSGARAARSSRSISASDPRDLDGVDGAIVIGTRRERDGEPIDGRLELGPREAVVASSGAAAS